MNRETFFSYRNKSGRDLTVAPFSLLTNFFLCGKIHPFFQVHHRPMCFTLSQVFHIVRDRGVTFAILHPDQLIQTLQSINGTMQERIGNQLLWSDLVFLLYPNHLQTRLSCIRMRYCLHGFLSQRTVEIFMQNKEFYHEGLFYYSKYRLFVNSIY